MKFKYKVLLIVFSVAMVTWAYRPVEKYFEVAKSLDIFSSLFKEVNTFYVDEVEPKKLVDTGINEMLSTLDPYTEYIPEESGETFSIITTGQYAGIGALIGQVKDKTLVRHPYVGYPAYEAGVRVGDELISIDGKNVKGKSSDEVSSFLKGTPKTEVEVVVRKPGATADVAYKMKRERIKLSNVVCQELIGGVGYIKMDEFTPGASKEVENAVIKLKAEGAKGIVFDLRENGGGHLEEAINIVNLFVNKGLEVVSTKGKVEEWNRTYKTLNNPLDTQIPLTILVSGGSASASEIVAGSLQDYDRAVLIGEKTFGKGLVQTTRQLPFKSMVKITTAKYYIPSGRCIQALDYTHRKSDGSVSKVADSLKSEFKTKNGRKVFDGGGLDPDIKSVDVSYGKILEALIINDLLFEYASLYCAKSPIPKDLKQFKFSDKDYADFVEWLKTKDFTYTTELEEQVKTLADAAKDRKENDEIVNSIQLLRNKVEQAKQNDFIRYKPEIYNALQEEIGFHYALHKGRFLVSAEGDAELQKAIKLLNDSQSYNSLLKGK